MKTPTRVGPIMVQDWTRRPLGAAREPLREWALVLAEVATDDASPQKIDATIRHLEEAIRAFRDNER